VVRRRNRGRRLSDQSRRPVTSNDVVWGGHTRLTSMRERAELAGGWFRIESRPGQGTTVWCWLPDDGPPLLDISPPDDA
jgi:signal transduction histidine kinase